MRQPTFASVEGFRPSTFNTAALHPAHSWTVLACSSILLLMGLGIPAVTVVLIDLVALALLPRTGVLRRQLRERSMTIARRRAAERLTPDEHKQWRELDGLAR